MVLLHSEQKSLGQPLPNFNLTSVDGKNYTGASFKDRKVLVVMFICNHCPYVQAIEDRIIALSRHYQGRSVQFVGICSNDPTDYPDDRPEKLKERWLQKNYGFPYLIDDSQDAARDFGAVCTPDIFVYDAKRNLAYHGQVDDNWKEPQKVKRQDLKEAIDLLLKEQAAPAKQTPSMGCSIKWKK